MTLVALLSGSSGFFLAEYLDAQEDDLKERRIRNAVSFLTRVQFNPELNLTREGTGDSLTRNYWLLSDNLIASKALWPYNATVSSRIQKALTSLGYLTNGLHEALFGLSIPVPPSTSIMMIVRNMTSYQIKVELHNSTNLFTDYPKYGDLLIYVALSSQWQGARTHAVANFTKAVSMWDGKGIKDQAFNGEYQTYKLALVLYASKTLNILLQYEREMRDQMWAMQRADGGLWTGYDSSLSPVSVDANTETTALAILAGS